MHYIPLFAYLVVSLIALEMFGAWWGRNHWSKNERYAERNKAKKDYNY